LYRIILKFKYWYASCLQRCAWHCPIW